MHINQQFEYPSHGSAILQVYFALTILVLLALAAVLVKVRR